MFGVMDLGSNSFISLVVDGKEDVFEELKVTKLGSRLREGRLEGCRDFKPVFEDMLSRVLGYTPNFRVFGTAVFRRAINGAECLKEIVGETPHEILSEEAEARYSFLSVVRDDSLKIEDPVVFDLGGGSLEIVSHEHHVSLPFGTWVIRERLNLLSPVEIVEELVEELEVYRGTPVGVGGTFVTIASFKLGKWNLKEIHGMKIELDDVMRLIDLIERMEPEEVGNLPFVPKGRGDTLLAGSLVTWAIMRRTNKPIVVSRRGYRYGIAWEMDGSS